MSVTVETCTVTIEAPRDYGSATTVATIGAYTEPADEVRRTVNARLKDYLEASSESGMGTSLADFTLYLVTACHLQHGARKGVL